MGPCAILALNAVALDTLPIGVGTARSGALGFSVVLAAACFSALGDSFDATVD